MGFFGLFGGSKKKKEAPKAAAPAPVAAAPAPAVPAGTPPEVIAAISGAISMVMNDDEMIAAMAAAIQHAGGGVAVVRIKKTEYALGSDWPLVFDEQKTRVLLIFSFDCSRY